MCLRENLKDNVHVDMEDLNELKSLQYQMINMKKVAQNDDTMFFIMEQYAIYTHIHISLH